MRRALMVMISALSLTLGMTSVRAADTKAADTKPAAKAEAPAGKVDCSEKQKALDDANATAKAAAKPDLSSCKDKKGKELTECEKPLKEKAKTDAMAAKDKAKEAKTALDCCKNPKKKGCTS